jgi:hypothetical protein
MGKKKSLTLQPIKDPRERSRLISRRRPTLIKKLLKLEIEIDAEILLIVATKKPTKKKEDAMPPLELDEPIMPPLEKITDDVGSLFRTSLPTVDSIFDSIFRADDAEDSDSEEQSKPEKPTWLAAESKIEFAYRSEKFDRLAFSLIEKALNFITKDSLTKAIEKTCGKTEELREKFKRLTDPIKIADRLCQRRKSLVHKVVELEIPLNADVFLIVISTTPEVPLDEENNGKKVSSPKKLAKRRKIELAYASKNFDKAIICALDKAFGFGEYQKKNFSTKLEKKLADSRMEADKFVEEQNKKK